MQNIEMKHVEVMKFEKNFKYFQEKFASTLSMLESLKEVPRMLER